MKGAGPHSPNFFICVIPKMQSLPKIYNICHADWPNTYSVGQKKSPPMVFWNFSPNGWEFLINFLHTYCTIISTLDYKFLFNYPRFWRSYAILSATTQYAVHIICSKYPQPAETHALTCLRKSLFVASNYKINTFIMSTNMWDMTWRQQWRHLPSKQT